MELTRPERVGTVTRSRGLERLLVLCGFHRSDLISVALGCGAVSRIYDDCRRSMAAKYEYDPTGERWRALRIRLPHVCHTWTRRGVWGERPIKGHEAPSAFGGLGLVAGARAADSMRHTKYLVPRTRVLWSWAGATCALQAAATP